MPKHPKQPDLNAVTLKNTLWETLQEVRNGTMEPGTADSIASQSREIIRVIRAQLTILRNAQNPISEELHDFAVPKGL